MQPLLKIYSRRSLSVAAMAEPVEGAVAVNNSSPRTLGIVGAASIPLPVSRSVDVAPVPLREGAPVQAEDRADQQPPDGQTTIDIAVTMTSPPVNASPRTVFITKVLKPVGDVLSIPAVTKRRKKSLPSTFVPRRSRRVAKLPPETDHTAATTVCRQLGFITVEEQDPVPPMQRYAKVFDQPLSREHFKALTALFGWNSPPEGGAQAAGSSSAV